MADATPKNAPKHRMRRWHVAFGNPALGTYNGSIVTIHPRGVACQRPSYADDTSYDGVDSDAASCDSFSSCSSIESLVRCGEKDDDNREEKMGGVGSVEIRTSNRTAVMTNVPPYQVPDGRRLLVFIPLNILIDAYLIHHYIASFLCTGVLNLVRSHRPFIEHVRIVIGSSKSQERQHRKARRWEKRQKQLLQDREGQIKHREEQQQHQADQEVRRRSLTWACENEDIDEGDNTNVLVSLKHEQLKPDINRDGRSFSLDVMQASREMSTTIFDSRDHGDEEAAAEEKVEQIDDEDKNYHLLFLLNSDASAETFVTDLHKRPCKLFACFISTCCISNAVEFTERILEKSQ